MFSDLCFDRCQKFSSFVFEGAVDSNVVISCFDIIARSIEKETVIVLDNAPIHRSEEFEEKIEEWAQKNLKIYFLPTYCPSLNTHRNALGKDKIRLAVVGGVLFIQKLVSRVGQHTFPNRFNISYYFCLGA